jgi:hypothetical protein
MNKKLLGLGIVCFALPLSGWLLRGPATHGQDNKAVPDNGTSLRRPWQLLEAKARAAEAGDQSSVRALADQILNQWPWSAELPSEVTEAVEERFVQAEIHYRQGRAQGIEAETIAGVNNDVVQRLGLPEYMKLCPQQVWHMRLATLGLTPSFMGKGMTRKNMQVGEKMNPAMSPLQAAHVIMFGIQQKLFNPDFQVTPAEWNHLQYKRQLQRWQAYRQSAASGSQLAAGQPNSPPQLEARENPKMKEILDRLQNRTANMGLDDALQLLHGALDTLGIER